MEMIKLAPNFAVQDIEKTVVFYRDVLGFKLEMAVPEDKSGVEQELSEKKKYYNLPRKRRNKLLTLLKQNGVVAVLTGHVHMIIVNDYKGIQLVTGETTSKNLYGRPLGFRFWHVSPTLIKHEFIPLIYKDVKQKTTVDKNKLLS